MWGQWRRWWRTRKEEEHERWRRRSRGANEDLSNLLLFVIELSAKIFIYYNFNIIIHLSTKNIFLNKRSPDQKATSYPRHPLTSPRPGVPPPLHQASSSLHEP
jgi:hypothetical protein